jgi:hypothetical protein
MAAREAGHSRARRGVDPLEHYVRRLLRDADRLQRSTRTLARRAVEATSPSREASAADRSERTDSRH